MHHGLDANCSLIHRDVKPENILLTKDSIAKLADLGEARFQNKQNRSEATAMSLVGTLYYLAPEILLGDEYNEKVDVYSFGVLLNEMNTKVMPYTSGKNKVPGFQKRYVVRHENYLRPWIGWDDATCADKKFIKLAVLCWKSDASLRPSMEKTAQMLERLHSCFIGNTFVDDGDFEDDGYFEDEAASAPLTSYGKPKPSGSSYDTLNTQQLLEKLREKDLEISTLKAQLSEVFGTQFAPNIGAVCGDYHFEPCLTESLLGRGKLSKVHRVINPHDKKKYALKCLSLTSEKQCKASHLKELKCIQQEIQNMCKLDSKHFIRYYTSGIDAGLTKFNILMELVEGASLHRLILSRQKMQVRFTRKTIMNWTKQICEALKYLHGTHKVAHEDLISKNVMITGCLSPTNFVNDEEALEKSGIKILNLGVSRLNQDRDRMLRFKRSTKKISVATLHGHPSTRAPEINAAPGQSSVFYNSKVDMWSTGILVCEATLCMPMEQWFSEVEVMKEFANKPKAQKYILEKVGKVSKHFYRITKQLLEPEPRLRIRASELLENFEGITGFLGVSKREKAKVNELNKRILHTIGDSPEHVTGPLALLRILRVYDGSIDRAEQKVLKICKFRKENNCNQIYRDIMEKNLTFDSLPGTTDLKEASWNFEDFLTIDKSGNLVMYVDWGSISFKAFKDSGITLKMYTKNLLYRAELRSIILNFLSIKRKEVLKYSLVANLDGVTLEYRHLLDHFKQFVIGAGQQSVPPQLSKAYLVGMGRVASIIYHLAFKSLSRLHVKIKQKMSNVLENETFCTNFSPVLWPLKFGGKGTNQVTKLPPFQNSREKILNIYQRKILRSQNIKAATTTGIVQNVFHKASSRSSF